MSTAPREGSLEAPTRHALNWKDPAFYDEASVMTEMERVFDICHGCRRCVSLCNSFPTLFDLVDESDTMEVDGVDKKDYWKVVDECYLCDLCFLTKCPYVPPHEWDLDFPHLMLQAKAIKFKKGETRTRDKIISSTDTIGKLAGIPIVVNVVNAATKDSTSRKLMDSVMGIHPNAFLPEYTGKTLHKQMKSHSSENQPSPSENTRGQVALFATCYGNYNEPDIGLDLVKVFEHNRIPVRMTDKEKCCGMPKLELGDLKAVESAKDVNVPELARLIREGWDIVGPVPSCVLMFKQELPLLFPDDAEVKLVAENIYDPFEYLMLRHKDKALRTDFTESLGEVAYHVACHQRVQRIGMKTRDMLQLVPGTQVTTLERCSGHDGTYATKSEFHETATKICRPVVNRIKQAEVDHYCSDCAIAGHHIANGLDDDTSPEHPISLIRQAYGI